jgi:hypothetical protein
MNPSIDPCLVNRISGYHERRRRDNISLMEGAANFRGDGFIALYDETRAVRMGLLRDAAGTCFADRFPGNPNMDNMLTWSEDVRR